MSLTLACSAALAIVGRAAPPDGGVLSQGASAKACAGLATPDAAGGTDAVGAATDAMFIEAPIKRQTVAD